MSQHRTNTNAASITTLADEVYEISANRGLTPILMQKPTNSEEAEAITIDKVVPTDGADPDEKDTMASEATSTTTVSRNIENEEDKAKKPVSDRQVYLRYARAMGFKNAGIFLILIVGFAICLKFPGMSLYGPVNSALYHFALVTISGLKFYRSLGTMVGNRYSAG